MAHNVGHCRSKGTGSNADDKNYKCSRIIHLFNRIISALIVAMLLLVAICQVMDYKKALENLRQYNREYSTGNELLESVVACINYIVEDSENESKDDLLEVAEIVKNDLLPKVEQKEYTHCDFPPL